MDLLGKRARSERGVESGGLWTRSPGARRRSFEPRRRPRSVSSSRRGAPSPSRISASPPCSVVSCLALFALRSLSENPTPDHVVDPAALERRPDAPQRQRPRRQEFHPAALLAPATPRQSPVRRQTRPNTNFDGLLSPEIRHRCPTRASNPGYALAPRSNLRQHGQQRAPRFPSLSSLSVGRGVPIKLFINVCDAVRRRQCRGGPAFIACE